MVSHQNLATKIYGIISDTDLEGSPDSDDDLPLFERSRKLKKNEIKNHILRNGVNEDLKFLSSTDMRPELENANLCIFNCFLTKEMITDIV